MTTAQGQLVRRVLAKPHGSLEIVGLANEYASYCVSEDEYAAQDYAGASTMWGPGEGGSLACRLSGLRSAAEISSRRAPERSFWPGVAPRDAFGRGSTSIVVRPDAGLEQVLRDRAGLPERKLPWFQWEESPSAPDMQQAVARHVAIRIAHHGAWRDLEDDAGANFLTVYLGRERWGAIWLGPLFRDGVRGTFSFSVKVGGLARCSQPFAIGPGAALPDHIEAGSCHPGASLPPS